MIGRGTYVQMKRQLLVMTMVAALTIGGVFINPARTAVVASDACSVTPEDRASMYRIARHLSELDILQFGRGPGVSDEWLDAPATRAAVAVLLARALGWEGEARKAQDEVPFADMNGHWASGA